MVKDELVGVAEAFDEDEPLAAPPHLRDRLGDQLHHQWQLVVDGRVLDLVELVLGLGLQLYVSRLLGCQ